MAHGCLQSNSTIGVLDAWSVYISDVLGLHTLILEDVTGLEWILLP